jgi:hypothetical protein
LEEALRSSLVKAEFGYAPNGNIDEVGVTFDEINKKDMAYAWVNSVMVPAVYNDFLYDHNRVFGEKYIRMTIRRADFTSNDIGATKDVVPDVRSD